MFYPDSYRGKSQQTPRSLLEVTGEAEMAVTPDLASIHLGVVTENKDLLPAQRQNAAEMAKVIQSLTQLNIPKNNIQTFDYRMDSEYDFEQGKQHFRGYKVTHLLQVKIEDLANIGKVIDTAVQNGANYVANVQFMSKKTTDIYEQVLANAVLNAIKKAAAISAVLRVQLNPRPLSVIEGSGISTPSFTQPGSYVKGISTTQIEPGQLTLKATITAKFQYDRI